MFIRSKFAFSPLISFYMFRKSAVKTPYFQFLPCLKLISLVIGTIQLTKDPIAKSISSYGPESIDLTSSDFYPIKYVVN